MWELTEQAKIPACKVDIIKAALNLGKRAWLDATPIMSNLSSPEAAARVFSWHLAKLPVEKIAVACLNSQNEALSVEVLSVGTASECLCDAKIIFRHIIQSGATRWMLAHNHPSFSPDPSPEDLKLTEGLLQASQTIYLPLMDHIIIGDGTFTSLRSTTSLWQQFPQGD
jgi:DNA repair protein RadC